MLLISQYKPQIIHQDMKKISLFIWLSVFYTFTAWAQDPGMGMNFDDNAYDKVLKKAPLLTRNYQGLPAKASLKEYCPIPQSQGQFGTCVGWSSAYAGRTIVEAKTNGWKDKTQITNNAFSPLFVYSLIKFDDDLNCQNGTYINKALDIMRETGVSKFDKVADPCPTPDALPEDAFTNAAQFKIQDYAKLFGDAEDKVNKIRSMKKALSSGNPVIIGMKLPPSFFKARGVWSAMADENPANKYGGHAMCVIGYDDEKEGGAFEIMNSWGSNWGNEGFIWVKYEDFVNYTKYAYEVIALPQNTNQAEDLSGQVTYQLANGQEMKAKFAKSVNGVGYYQMQESYSSGTTFRLYITNNEPAFVYAFGSDLKTGKNFTIFPNEPGISPALNYAGNAVAIPDERYYVQMDNTLGKDYLCVLYSQETLSITKIEAAV
ncbi:MAG TPA: cysteine protease [Microscillaceae bacterium]|nr:cysteine protease [Microscillaceae bacterium]